MVSIAVIASLGLREAASAPLPGQVDPTGRYVVSDLAERIIPSIVTIYVDRDMKDEIMAQLNAPGNRALRRFFGQLPDIEDPEAWIAKTSGSGIVVSSDGYILTNQHVLGDTTGDFTITVTFWDDSVVKGPDVKVVAVDRLTDLALLKVEKRGLQPIRWGDSDKLRIGERIIAIGSPLDLRQTVTDGIVCAKHRDIGDGLISSLIQTNAVINPGSSGGALVNFDGEVVGINRLITSTTGGWQGYGFAIPSNDARAFVEQVLKEGRVIYGYVGILMETLLDERVRRTLGLAGDVHGARVLEVYPGTPAQEAGLMPGDVVVEVDGKPIETSVDLQRYVARSKVGSTIRMQVLRLDENGRPQRQTLNVKVGLYPEEQLRARPGARPTPSPQPVQSADALGVIVVPDEGEGGLRITAIAPGSPGEKLGLQPGDVLLRLNQAPLRQPDDLDRALAGRTTRRTMTLLFRRDGREYTMPIDPSALVR